MGYTTDFEGSFAIDKPLKPEHAAYLRKFADTRRMKRDEKKASKLPDPIRLAVALPIGRDGGYFVEGSGFGGQDGDPSVVDMNGAPEGQPGLWCQWVPSADGAELTWDGGEKFYEYVAWLEYLIEHFLKPWGYVVNGSVTWQGEDRNDIGKLIVKKNKVSTSAGKITYDL